MSETAQDRIKPLTIVLIVAAGVTTLMGIAVIIAYLSRPQPITLSISAPAGGVVLCDLVIDGRPDSRRDSAPVTYVLEAKQVRFAVIPENADDGNVKLEISGGGGTATAGGAGVHGSASVGTVRGGVSIGNMSPQHVENMRSSRATSDGNPDASINEAVRPGTAATSPAAR